jgi:signal transduction histidine kinase
VNAIDAQRDAHNGPREIILRSAREGTDFVAITVEDSGAGFAEEIADKLFDPFFTTKQDGIGMGLPISRSIVESHAGKLWAFSRPGGGAVFHFKLPLDRNA